MAKGNRKNGNKASTEQVENVIPTANETVNQPETKDETQSTEQVSTEIPPTIPPTNNDTANVPEESGDDDAEGEGEGKRKNYLKGRKILFSADEIDACRQARDEVNEAMKVDGTKGFVRSYKVDSPEGITYYVIGRHSGEAADAILVHLGWASELIDGKPRGKVADPNTVLRNVEKGFEKLSQEQIQALLAKYAS